MTDPYDEYSPSRVHWFGTAWPRPDYRAEVCSDDRYRVEVPVGAVCETGCNQLIDADDSGVRVMFYDGQQGRFTYQHVECFLRDVMCPWTMGLLPPPHEHGDDRRAEGRLILDHIRRSYE